MQHNESGKAYYITMNIASFYSIRPPMRTSLEVGHTVPISFLLFFLFMGSLQAQDLPFTIGSESYFNRQLDAMRWQYDGSFHMDQEQYRIQLNNRFNSRLYVSDGSARNVQDENELQVSLRRWIDEQWAITGMAKSYSFTTTNLREDMGHIGVLYNPHEEIELNLMGGLMSDRRSQNLDQGWSGVFQARSRPIHTGDFTFHPRAELQYADISPRRYSTLRFTTGSEYRFEDFVMRGRFSLSSGTRESYQPSSFFNRELSDIIESISNDSTALDMLIRIPVIENLDLEIDLYTLGNTRIVEGRPIEEDFDENIFDNRTRRREFQLRSLAGYEFNRNRIAVGLNFNYTHRGSRLINTGGIPEDQVTRRNEILRNSNYDRSRFELFTLNRIRLTDNNELALRAQTGILRYDTPDLNQDDRDELSYLIMLTNRHVFSPFFNLTVRAGGEATHYVYLSAIRSIENNWRRSIRLSPEMQWQPHDRLELRNSFMVRANYTVEDFQLEDRPKNDQASREYIVRSAADISITDDWHFELGGSRSELRIGRLYWDTFQETPTDTLITYDTEAMIVRESGRHRIGLGGRFFMRRDFLPQAIITTEVPDADGEPVPVTRAAPGLRTTRQYGPSVDIRLHFSSDNQLIISGWLQNQSVRRRLYTTYTEDVKEAFRREEQQATRRTYPNLELRAVFSF